MPTKELIFDPIETPEAFSLTVFNKHVLDNFDVVRVNSKRKNKKITLCRKQNNILFIKHPNHPVNQSAGIAGRLNWMIQWAWINKLNFLLVYSSELTSKTINETLVNNFLKCIGREYPYKFRLKKVFYK